MLNENTKKEEKAVKTVVKAKEEPTKEKPLVLQVKLINSNATVPNKNRESDAGFDLYATEDIEILVNEKVTIGTGVAMSIPEGYYGRIADRSSMAARGIEVSGGVVDSEYRGEVKVILTNRGFFTRDFEKVEFKDTFTINETKNKNQPYTIKKGNKIAQIIIEKIGLPEVEVVKDLPKSSRGTLGFGSSGK